MFQRFQALPARSVLRRHTLARSDQWRDSLPECYHNLPKLLICCPHEFLGCLLLACCEKLDREVEELAGILKSSL